jgi:VanZ family protein
LAKKLKLKILSFLPALLWLIFTVILLVMPGPDIPEEPFFEIIYFDKWVHIGMFGILTFLWCLPFLKSKNRSKKLFWVIAVCSISYGVLMEFVQKYLAFERDFDLLDIIADSVGSLLALIWLFYFLRLKQFEKNKPL